MAKRFDALNRLIDGMKLTAHDYRDTTDVFPSLDVEKLAKTLNLRSLGDENGRKNQPAAGTKAPDDVEQKIVTAIEDEKKSSYQILSDHLATFSERLKLLNLENQFSAIRNTNSSSLSEFKAEVAKGVDELHGLRRHLQEAEIEVVDFRERHGLKRVARVPSAAKLFFRWSVIAAMILLETIVNGLFLATGSEQGIVGGIIQALAFAALNIGGALLISMFWARLFVRRSIFSKVLGMCGIAAYCVFALAINLALAHYREVAERSFANVGVEVVTRIKTDIFGLNDLNSWVLLGIGILMSVIAFIDGWQMSDPYQGYASAQKRLDNARASYRDAKESLIDNIREMRDEHNEKIELIIKELSTCRTEAQAILGHRSRLVNLFSEHQSQLERTCNALLTIYRDSNRSTRTEPEPKHFGNPYKMERLKAAAFAKEEWDDKDVAKRIQLSQDELSKQSIVIGQEVETSIEQYKKLDNLFPEGFNVQTQAA